MRLYAWRWLSGLRSAGGTLCWWDPDGFNLSPATPSVTGGSRGSSGCPGGARTGGVSSGTLLVKHLKKKIEIYAEFDSESFKNTPRLGRGGRFSLTQEMALKLIPWQASDTIDRLKGSNFLISIC